MFSFFRKAKLPPITPFDFSKNRFLAHSKWPPVFSDLTGKEQFRLERKVRRRAKLKWARPIWNRNLTLIQWASIIFVLTYGTLFVDWGMGTQEQEAPGPLLAIRRWVDSLAGSIWTYGSSEGSREQVLQVQEGLRQEEASRRGTAP